MKISTRDSLTISGMLFNRENFTTHGSLWGNVGAGNMGQLPREYWAGAMRAEYTVYSYNTPIAWLENGVWMIPSVKYSVTTSRHQSKIAHAITL